MRPIDADELKDNFSKVSFSGLAAYGFGLAELYSGVSKMLELIDEAPTIEPVKRGKWLIRHIFDRYNQHRRYEVICSVCKEHYPKILISKDMLVRDMFNYCPNCGAKMDGGVNELD